jgi:hypothetical protein
MRHPARHNSLFAAMYNWSLPIDITGCNSNPEKRTKQGKRPKHYSRVSYKQSNSSSGNPPSSSRNSLLETTGEKPEGSRAAQFVWAALEPSGFSMCCFSEGITGVRRWVSGTRVTLFITYPDD